MLNKFGILITNTGTPDAPTPPAIRSYLREFLSDKHIVQLPHLIWLPILYGLILTTRPYQSAKLYQKIWTENGSPMRFFMQQLKNKLQQKIEWPVEIGMNYGNPSIQAGLERLQHQVEKIIILPIFPQYSDTTTGASIDHIKMILKKWQYPPLTTFISSYADNPHYIDALAKKINQSHYQAHSSHLLISFHGIPKRFVAAGDPYQTQCERTAQLIAQALNLADNQWTLCYQSQFGYAKWLQPSTFDKLSELPKQGIKQISIVCPGFAVDCLETLEEIAIRGKEIFLQSGGSSFQYIPALNDSDLHSDMLANIIKNN